MGRLAPGHHGSRARADRRGGPAATSPATRGGVVKLRPVARWVVVVLVVALQLGFIVRGYWSDHKPFAFQMFPEASTWRADVVRVTTDGRRVPVEVPWAGYRWDDLVGDDAGL